jgi:hypothetical protein
MLTPTKSPIIEFFISKENLPAVLEVIRCTEQIRDRLALKFWMDYQSALNRTKPANLAITFSSKTEVWKSNHYFQLFADWGKTDNKTAHLKYQLEVGPDYFGAGLRWFPTAAKDFETLSRLKPVRALQGFLKEKRPTAYESEATWFWWEPWEQLACNDPWWMAKEFGQDWYRDRAAKFWTFFEQTQVSVLEANSALKRH